MTDAPLEIRRLSYSDLPQVIAIERRSFPTPWSLAMFVLELSKPSGICLAAVRDGKLVGYMVCSRVRCSNQGAIALYEGFGFHSAGLRRRYYQDNGEDAVIMWRTPATLNGSLEDVPGAARTVRS